MRNKKTQQKTPHKHGKQSMEHPKSAVACLRSQSTLNKIQCVCHPKLRLRSSLSIAMSSSIFGNRCLDYQRQAQGVEKQTTLVVGDAPEPSERRELQIPQNNASQQKILDELCHVQHRPARCGPPAQNRHASATTHWYPVWGFQVGLPGCLSRSNTPRCGLALRLHSICCTRSHAGSYVPIAK